MKRIKTLSCGCCSDGCVCLRHQPTSYACARCKRFLLSPKCACGHLNTAAVCDFHRQNPHPRITGEEVYRDGEEALSRFFDNAPRMIYGGRW